LSLFAIFDKSDGGFKPVYFYTFYCAVGVYDAVLLLEISTSFSAFAIGFLNTLLILFIFLTTPDTLSIYYYF
jgi:hypothetical protein